VQYPDFRVPLRPVANIFIRKLNKWSTEKQLSGRAGALAWRLQDAV
jgi:hypothetical protein